MNRKATQPDQHRRGLSLVETVLSLLILGGAFVALLNTVSSSRAAQGVAGQRQYAQVLAADLMAEILNQDQYTEPGVFGLEADEKLSGNQRSAFDDIDDYDSWSANPPTDIDGDAVEGAQGLTRSASVKWVDPDSPDTDSGSDQGLVRVTVTVQRGEKILAQVIAYRSDVWVCPEECH
ncbi:MAG: hypothetical protein KTR15_13480 [Phycisphaeraceae bacterium]|nr:hypothetical protein [Phycisphaeraceae bacterium]